MLLDTKHVYVRCIVLASHFQGLIDGIIAILGGKASIDK